MKKTLKIIVASDHAGFERKNNLLAYLKQESFDVEDVGAHVFDKDDDYPEFMVRAAMRVVEDPENTKAIIFGMSGQGEAIVANRLPGVRAAVWYGGSDAVSLDIIRLSREHNDANVLSIGAGFVTKEEMIAAVRLWLATPFSGEERHKRRIEEIDSIE
ncbi:MAG: RpiB/LacA/LacB family sugar-phosphate isomerase [Candidatus Pacebacteria bacterium]|nr:RpiB/LacA/LacB family sugar-phosphate isomerase [Candidatus Paceibacterota bacterium]